MAMLAKYKGTCRNCGQAIEVNQPMSWARRGTSGGSRAWHVDCKDVWGTSNNDAVKNTEGVKDTSFAEALNQASSTGASYTSYTKGAAQASTVEGKATVSLDLGETLRQLVEQSIANVPQSLSAIATDQVQAMIAHHLMSFKPSTATVTTVVLENRATQETRDLGIQHKDFALLLRMASARDVSGHCLNIWLAGPAGTGKTTAARKVSEALGLPFYYTGSIDTQYALTGFINAHGQVISTEFRKAYSEGGVFLFDEVDGSSPNATLAFNAALANGHAVFPDGQLARHKDFVCIAAANTWGLGATNEYVGRNKLDAAFLDRFVMLPWGIDEALETATCGNAEWSKRVQQVRANVQAKGIKVLVTPRASYFGAALLASGLEQASVEAATIRKGMTEDQWNSVKGEPFKVSEISECVLNGVRLSKTNIDDMRNLANLGQLINAIKLVREITGAGLLEAKRFVENHR